MWSLSSVALGRPEHSGVALLVTETAGAKKFCILRTVSLNHLAPLNEGCNQQFPVLLNTVWVASPAINKQKQTDKQKQIKK